MIRWLSAWLVFLAALTAAYFLMGEVNAIRHMEGRPLVTAALMSVGLLTSDILLPIPSSIVMTFNGALFSFLPGALVSMTGLLAGAAFGYWMSRLCGRKMMRLIAGDRADGTVSPFFERFGAAAVILSRPIPLIAETVTCMAGTAAMPFWPFMLGQVIGGVPLAVGYAWAGNFAADSNSALLAVAIPVMVPSALWLIWAATRPLPTPPEKG